MANENDAVSEVLQEDATNTKNQLSDSAKGVVKSTAKKALIAPITIIKDSAKTALSKANPIDKPINKDDVTDSGVESLRLGYDAGKKGYRGIKTVGRTIKTTQRTIKTTKNVVGGTSRTIRNAGRMMHRTATFTAKAVTTTVRIAGNVAANVVAAATNPMMILIAAVLVIVIMLAALVVLLFSSVSAAQANAKAYSGAAGLGDVPAQYQAALNYFNIAVQNQRNGFNELLDNMYYNSSDLGHSDLLYGERTKKDGTVTVYEKNFSSDAYRNVIKSHWEFGITAQEGISIAYVYLEKVMNEANGTENAIYSVSYTQDVFDIIVAKCVAYNNTMYDRQQCPSSICSRHVVPIPNPDYTVALEANNRAAGAYNDWTGVAGKIYYHNHKIGDGSAQVTYWNNYVVPAINEWILKYNRDDVDYTNDGNTMLEKLGREYESAAETLKKTPQTIDSYVYNCELNHTLNSFGLYFYDKNTVMDALGFTDSEKQWVTLTETGFKNNPDIP